MKEKDNTNYFVDDGVCDALPPAAHPTERTTTIRNNLQATTEYDILEPPAALPNASSEAESTDPSIIYQATNIIAASDSSVDPITGEATYNWRITTYDKKGLITAKAPLLMRILPI
jgi:hypothetical protein